MQGCICACVHVCGVYVWVHGLHVQCVKSVHVFVCLSLEIGIQYMCAKYICLYVLYVYIRAWLAVQCVHSAHLYVFTYIEVHTYVAIQIIALKRSFKLVMEHANICD